MTVTMPQGLQDLASVVVGADFPEGDEDALRRLGEAWAACAGEVETVLGDTEGAVKDALSTMEGQTAESFKEFGDRLTQGEEAPLVALQKMCEEVGEACDNLALDVEYTKISIITALSILFAQIAAMLALAAVTFGASTAGIPAAQAATQGIVRGIMQGLLKLVQEVVKQIAINLGINVGVDFAIQGGQALAGDRDGLDTDKTTAAALSGAAGGLGGGIANGVFGAVGKNLGGRLFGEAAETGAESAGKAGGEAAGKIGGKTASGANLVNGMAGGTAGGVMGAGMNNQFQADNAGEDVEHTEQSMGSGASGGAIGGGASSAGSFRESFDTLSSGTLSGSGGGNGPGGSGGQGWQEWDGAPPVGSETEIFAGGDQSGDAGSGSQTGGSDTASDADSFTTAQTSGSDADSFETAQTSGSDADSFETAQTSGDSQPGNDQSGSSGIEQQAKDGLADGTADMKDPHEWTPSPEEIPPHLVNGTDDDYPIGAGEIREAAPSKEA
ncbi:hypothetical protein IQ251_00640 [Saccharopolyspora sp. HNM0983]|uniref:Outer membrane channel protein CpnT-like N-terminal domain-containing protein n=1 Tax=Saccharopolyspora montiporae TaxID=2781240 RepID=A0A929B635_9PSEU|nr:hypothetical protein [Saccharopolyspora sp. HNM0983]MBE9372945.1 hypothetical protein [Saccharopolyspora sp. HNM0983]